MKNLRASVSLWLTTCSLQPDVLELERLALDAGGGRGDPVGDLARLRHGVHETPDVLSICERREPSVPARLELLGGNQVAFEVEVVAGVLADVTVEARRGEPELVVHALLGDVLVPALKRALAVAHVLAAQHLVQGIAQRHLALTDAAALDDRQREGVFADEMVGVLLLLLVASLQPRGEEVCGVRAVLAAEEVERVGEPVVDVALDDVEGDAAEAAHVLARTLLRQLRGASDDAPDAGLADEEVVRLLREHELAGARQRLEARLGERRELILAVAVGEHRKAEEVEPVVAGLVEGFEDSGLVGVSRTALKQGVGLVAAVASEVAVEQIDHRPEVATLLDVDLKEIAQVIQRRAGLTQTTLLLDRGGLGIGLRDDDAAQSVAELAGDFLISGLPGVVAKVDARVRLGGLQEDAPAVVGHPYVVEVRPAVGFDADGRAQPDVLVLKALGAHLAPPVEVVRQPLLKRPLEPLVARKVYVVRNPLV